MFKRKILFSIGVGFIFTLLTVQPVIAADLTWHSSVTTGASWKWSVSDSSGDLSTNNLGYFFPSLEEGFDIEISAVGDPPSVGDWTTLFFTSSGLAWADFYINGTLVTDSEEAGVYFFVSPLNIGNGTKGWETWVNLIYIATTFLLGGTLENSTSGNLITYLCTSSGGIGSIHWAISHEITYNTTTGILNKYKFEYSNTTLASSFTISKQGDDLIGDLNIPGFDLNLTIFSLGTIITLPIIHRKIKK